jgi:hypothetical protein
MLRVSDLSARCERTRNGRGDGSDEDEQMVCSEKKDTVDDIRGRSEKVGRERYNIEVPFLRSLDRASRLLFFFA